MFIKKKIKIQMSDKEPESSYKPNGGCLIPALPHPQKQTSQLTKCHFDFNEHCTDSAVE